MVMGHFGGGAPGADVVGRIVRLLAAPGRPVWRTDWALANSGLPGEAALWARPVFIRWTRVTTRQSSPAIAAAKTGSVGSLPGQIRTLLPKCSCFPAFYLTRFPSVWRSNDPKQRFRASRFQ